MSDETNLESKINILEYAKTLNKQATNSLVDERNIIFIGDKASGKSTLFNLIFPSKREKEAYVQTCGINYGYISLNISAYRKINLNGYEIGGGVDNIGLLKNIINEGNILNSVVIFTIDLGKPENFMKLFKQYTEAISSILKETCKQETLVDIVNNKKKSYNEKTNDSKLCSPFPCQLVIVGTKYDHFERIDV